MLEVLSEWIGYHAMNFAINVVWAITLAIWYIEKSVAWLVDQIVSGDAWETIVITITDSLGEIMPDVLRSVIFGTGGGLFFLALLFISFTLMVPWLIKRGDKMGELQRVLGWTIIISVLFVSSTVGYGIFGMLETARMGVMADLSSGWNSGQLSALVARPMSADDTDINVNEFVLPAAFEDEYFPEATAFETREIVWYDAPLFLGRNASTVTIETDESMAYRRSQASLGILLVVLNLIPLSIVVILGGTFAALTATALVLILFLIMSLPMGVFEVGELIIYQIVARYMLVWLLTIFVAVFPAILLGVSELTLSPPVTLEGLFIYIAVLLVAVYAVFHIAKWVISIAGESFTVIGNSINAAVRPYAPNSTAPMADRLPPSYVAGVAGAAGAAGLGAYAAIGAAGVMGGAVYAPLIMPYRNESSSSTGLAKTQEYSFAGSSTAQIPRQHVFQLEAENPVDGEWSEIKQINTDKSGDNGDVIDGVWGESK